MLKKKWWDNENPKNSIFIRFLVLRWRLRLRRRCFFQYLYNCLDFFASLYFLFHCHNIFNKWLQIFGHFCCQKRTMNKIRELLWAWIQKKIIAPGLSFRIFCRKWARLSQVENCRKKSQKAFDLRTLEEKTKSRLKLEGKFSPLTNQL